MIYINLPITQAYQLTTNRKSKIKKKTKFEQNYEQLSR
jgi:hypothetical protein